MCACANVGVEPLGYHSLDAAAELLSLAISSFPATGPGAWTDGRYQGPRPQVREVQRSQGGGPDRRRSSSSPFRRVSKEQSGRVEAARLDQESRPSQIGRRREARASHRVADLRSDQHTGASELGWQTGGCPRRGWLISFYAAGAEEGLGPSERLCGVCFRDAKTPRGLLVGSLRGSNGPLPGLMEGAWQERIGSNLRLRWRHGADGR